MFIGLGVIPASGDDALKWLKWAGMAIGLGACVATYIYRKQAASDAGSTPQDQ